MAEKIAKFRFEGYRITDCQIHINPEIEVSRQCNVSFRKTAGVNDSERKMRLLFDAFIESENKALRIEVRAEGLFEFDDEIKEEEKKIFFSTSAPAILFPYIRAYIGTLTSLSGIAPVVLPTLNLSDR